MNKVESAFLRLGKNDFIHGLYVAVVGAVIGFGKEVVTTALTTHQFGALLSVATLQNAGGVAVAAAGTYLMAKLTTNSQGKPLTPEPTVQQ